FMLVGKALMTVEGIGKELDPDHDVFGEAEPYFVDLLKKRYSPERLGMEVVRGVEQLSRVGMDVPMQVREVLDVVRLGRLVVKTADPDLPRVVDRLGRRLFMGLVVASAILAGALAWPSERTLAIALLGIAGVLLALHVMRDSR